MTEEHLTAHIETMLIVGEFAPDAFVPWIRRHAHKLGLQETIFNSQTNRIEMRLQGPEELISAMEAGCSLGPIDVWVETIVRSPDGTNS